MTNVRLSSDEVINFLKNVKERELWMYISLLALSCEYKCNMTQVEIGGVLGLHPTTVHKRIKELNNVYVQGHPLVRTVREGMTNVYYILKLEEL